MEKTRKKTMWKARKKNRKRTRRLERDQGEGQDSNHEEALE
jgi:hypothetical protein